MDATIYALVMHPALHDLLPHTPGLSAAPETIARWRLHSLALPHRLGRGRRRVRRGGRPVRPDPHAAGHDPDLRGVHRHGGLANTWWELAVYRFLTALGIGGEWAAGAALVAEVWPEEKRARAAGILQSAWAARFLLAATINLSLRDYGWRPIFVVGVAPAFVAILVRWCVRTGTLGAVPGERGGPRPGAGEPARALRARVAPLHAGRVRPRVRRGVRPVGATNWTPTLVRTPEVAARDAAAQTTCVSHASMLLNVGALAAISASGRWPSGSDGGRCSR